MTLAPPPPAPTSPPPAARPVRYATRLATSSADVEAALRLRATVFVEEQGVPAAAEADEWDDVCDHLVVRDEVSGDVVGTSRLLPPERAMALGRTYGDGEFDLAPHARLRPYTVEAGRSCVHPDHRPGGVIAALWGGIAGYVAERGHPFLAGCASVPLTDGGGTAAAVWDRVRTGALAPAPLQVEPRVPFDVEAPPRPAQPAVPPLLRAYLHVGAEVCGRPAHDPVSSTADFYVLLRLADVDPRVLPAAP